MKEATRVAAETGIDLYVKKGKNYELVPKDVVAMDARINSGDALKPVGVSKKPQAPTSRVKRVTLDLMRSQRSGKAIELGIDISSELPAELLPHYRVYGRGERAGIDTSERRSDIDIAVDMETIKEEMKNATWRKSKRT